MIKSVLFNLLVIFTTLSACSGGEPDHRSQSAQSHGSTTDEEPGKGPNRGRLLLDGDLALELAIFETGVPPEFRVWVTNAGSPVSPDDVEVQVTLTRLGGAMDVIEFARQENFLRGDTVIYEPHSFTVAVAARYRKKTHRWAYDNFEGRTRIGAAVAEASGLQTEIAGPATIREIVTVYGRVVSNPENVSHVNARFDGVIRSASASIGDVVREGQILAVIEANDSLNSYSITAPIGGTIIERHANPGETTGGRSLFTIVDPSSVWAELAVFPSDRARVRTGARVAVRTAIGDIRLNGQISLLSPVAGANQSVTARRKARQFRRAAGCRHVSHRKNRSGPARCAAGRQAHCPANIS